uniref:Uncharacterized protein n=1 Tax=Anguilla anguilla TaxID=7936 RepID=A0A0E9P5T7_ANGAN
MAQLIALDLTCHVAANLFSTI